MNIKTANRLIDLRKKHGYSQEELASKLGLSRQTISKWERSEASPDTDNLISLANLYGVSLDELLGMKEEDYDEEDLRSSEQIPEEDVTIEDSDNKDSSKSHYSSVVINDDGIKIGNQKFFNDDERYEGNDIHIELGTGYSGADAKAYGIYLRNKRSTSKKRLILAIVSPLCFLAALTAFLLVGFLVPDGAGWRWGWTFFFLVDIIPSFIAALYAHKFCRFNIATVVLFIFLFLGMYMGLWHPTWAIFLVLPIYYVVFGPIDTQIQIHRFKKWMSEHHIEANFQSDPKDVN